jgi:hypothetical protein
MDGYLKSQTLKPQVMSFQNSWLLFILTAFLFSCQSNNDKKEINDFNFKDVDSVYNKRNLTKLSTELYTRASDSVRTWIDHDLRAYQYEKGNDWQIDSLICINSDESKAVLVILNKDKYPTSKNDGIQYFYGVQISSRWYFFKGPFIVLFRESYSLPKEKPLTFPQLHAIAMKEVFRGYLKKNAQDEWEINERFFDRIEFQFEKWAYFDNKGVQIKNETLTKDSLTKLFLQTAVYDKWKSKK